MDTVQEQVAITLLRLGVKPHQVCVELNSMCWRTSGSKITAAEAVTAAASRIHFSNARNSITKDQIYALQKRVKRQAGWGLTPDVHAVAALVPELGAAWVPGLVPLVQAGNNAARRAAAHHHPANSGLEAHAQGVRQANGVHGCHWRHQHIWLSALPACGKQPTAVAAYNSFFFYTMQSP
jgi:hypothetical protein